MRAPALVKYLDHATRHKRATHPASAAFQQMRRGTRLTLRPEACQHFRKSCHPKHRRRRRLTQHGARSAGAHKPHPRSISKHRLAPDDRSSRSPHVCNEASVTSEPPGTRLPPKACSPAAEYQAASSVGRRSAVTASPTSAQCCAPIRTCSGPAVLRIRRYPEAGHRCSAAARARLWRAISTARARRAHGVTGRPGTLPQTPTLRSGLGRWWWIWMRSVPTAHSEDRQRCCCCQPMSGGSGFIHPLCALADHGPSGAGRAGGDDADPGNAGSQYRRRPHQGRRTGSDPGARTPAAQSVLIIPIQPALRSSTNATSLAVVRDSVDRTLAPSYRAGDRATPAAVLDPGL